MDHLFRFTGDLTKRFDISHRHAFLAPRADAFMINVSLIHERFSDIMESPRLSQDGNHAQTVLKALEVLECVAYTGQSLSAPEIAAKCGLTRPTAYRLISTLASRGYVASGQDGRYRLGNKLLSLSRSLIDYAELPEMARPHLRDLCKATGETVHLAILDDTELVYVAKVESSRSARMYSVVGVRNPLHSTALGKAILAFLPAEEREAILNRISLSSRTANTIVDRVTLENHLTHVRDDGYALDDVENEEGIRCVGAPIFNNSGRPIAALSISGPVVRVTRQKAFDHSKLVIQTAEVISSKLGYVAPPTPISSSSHVEDSTASYHTYSRARFGAGQQRR